MTGKGSPGNVADAPASQTDKAITLEEIRAASTTEKVNSLVNKISARFPKLKVTLTGTSIAAKQWYLVSLLSTEGLLHESQCAKVVEGNTDLQSQLAAIGLTAHQAQQGAAEAVALAREANRTAAAVQQEIAELKSQVQKLSGLLHQEAAAKEVTQDAPKQQQLADQAIWFDHNLPESELQGDPETQRSKVLAALQQRGLPENVTSNIISVSPLRKKEGASSPAPIVLKCRSLADKVALLRAAREASSPQQGLQLTARLTPWQQEQRKRLLPLLKKLKSEDVVARFFNGHVLQKRVGREWVNVDVSSVA